MSSTKEPTRRLPTWLSVGLLATSAGVLIFNLASDVTAAVDESNKPTRVGISVEYLQWKQACEAQNGLAWLTTTQLGDASKPDSPPLPGYTQIAECWPINAKPIGDMYIPRTK